MIRVPRTRHTRRTFPGRRATLSVAVLCAVVPVIHGQTPIAHLDRSDPVYVQHQQMVQRFTDEPETGSSDQPLILFSYTPTSDEDLFSISTRLQLPYGTIASLNRLDRPRLPSDGRALLVPNRPGLFAPSHPETTLERRLLARISQHEDAIEVRVPHSAGATTYFYAPALDFSEQERDLFMQGGFMHPIGGGTVSSPFGYRYHPFSKARLFHSGIDFAVDFGTPVYAAADGVVEEITREPLLGLSVTVAHRGDYQTRYAHLQETLVAVGDTLSEGDTLGYVGSTGMSTGPHLHFEVRYQGEPRDPERYILWE
ncbi:MAG: LysM peptidoglycan-binding domain-containing M23 family metallopeptidase [Alkalispirochaeta sp.]